MGATPTGPTLDPLNILVNKFNIATHVALILFLFSSWINYLLYDTKSVMVFWQLLSKIKRFVTIFRISWNGPTLFNIPIGDFPPVLRFETLFDLEIALPLSMVYQGISYHDETTKLYVKACYVPLCSPGDALVL